MPVQAPVLVPVPVSVQVQVQEQALVSVLVLVLVLVSVQVLAPALESAWERPAEEVLRHTRLAESSGLVRSS